MAQALSSYPDSYYAASANPHRARPALVGELVADVCVVGGGYTGLSTALHLAERGYGVVVLEAARVGWGASGRNGGQVGSGQRKDVLELEPWLGPERTARLWALAEEAKAIVSERIERHAIACDYKPGNLLAATRARYLDELAREAEHVERRFGYQGYRMLDCAETRVAVDSPCYVGGRLDRGGGHLHPLNFALGLAEACDTAGVRVFEGSVVERIEWGPRSVARTARGAVRASFVALAGNGYMHGVAPAIEPGIMPIGNHILATEPLGEARAAALIRDDVCVCATKFVVDYFRLSADRRLLFGGGETYSTREPSDLRGFVRRYMLRVFPQLVDVRIDYAWSGRLAITMSRLPHFGRAGPNGFYAHGFSGHGVALTQLAGRLLAEAIAGTAERFDLLASLPQRSFPGGTLLRKPLLVAGMLYFALRDRF